MAAYIRWESIDVIVLCILYVPQEWTEQVKNKQKKWGVAT